MHDIGELLAMAQRQPAQEACENLQSSLGTPSVTSGKLIASLELASKLVCANRIFDYPSAQSGNKTPMHDRSLNHIKVLTYAIAH